MDPMRASRLAMAIAQKIPRELRKDINSWSAPRWAA
jgi:orotate phosphoribosyltransferase